jgi:hypothetical protein
VSHQPPRRFRFMWRDGVFIPADSIAKYCDEVFGEGEIVTFERHEEVSAASRGHYHACIAEAWKNLPERDERFPTENALRKWALIRSGYCTKTEIVLDTPEQAATVAAFTGNAEGVIIVVRENVVVKYTAMSQSAQAMGKQVFQQSKDAVLDTIAELIAVKRKKLEDNAGRAA